jgi:hypothetical protein
VLFLLLVSAVAMQAQTFSVIHSFASGADGATPQAGLTVDRAGNLYGTTWGMPIAFGSAFRLANHGSGWDLCLLEEFESLGSGLESASKLVVGPDGSL